MLFRSGSPLVNARLFSIPNEAIRFDHLIKMHDPTPRYLLKSINRPIQLAHFLFKKDCPITPEERECMSRISYTSIVRSIIYVMMCTRPNVAYSLGVMSRYQSDLNENY